MYDEAYNNRRIISAGNTSDLAMHNNIYYSRFIIASDQASGSDILPEEAANALEQLRKANGISEDIRMPSPTALPPMKPHLCDKTSL